MDMALHVSLPVVCTPLYPFRFRSSGSYSVSNSVSHLSLIFGHKILHFRLATPDFIWVCLPLGQRSAAIELPKEIIFSEHSPSFSNPAALPAISPVE